MISSTSLRRALGTVPALLLLLALLLAGSLAPRAAAPAEAAASSAGASTSASQARSAARRSAARRRAARRTARRCRTTTRATRGTSRRSTRARSSAAKRLTRRTARVERSRCLRARPTSSTAPRLYLEGRTLRWKGLAAATRFQVRRRALSTRHWRTSKRSLPAVGAAGDREATYAVRHAVDGAPWSNEVTVDPAPKGDSRGEPATAGEQPAPRPAPAGVGFQPGMNGGRDPIVSPDAVARTGATYVRIEYPIGTPVAQMRTIVGAYADKGIRVLLESGFWMTLPTPEQASSLGTWAKEFGPGGDFWAGRADGHLAVRHIEFGNENSYRYQGVSDRGGEYALRLKEAHEAIRAANPNVGIMAQADDYYTQGWLPSMFAAVPDLASRVDGWTIHPYMRQSERLGYLLDKLRALGVPETAPIDITEFGLATDNARCLSDNYEHNKCMGFDEAGRVLTDEVAAMRAQLGGRLRSMMVYQAHDQRRPGETSDREHYFGALRSDLSDKGAYTGAVRALMGSS